MTSPAPCSLPVPTRLRPTTRPVSQASSRQAEQTSVRPAFTASAEEAKTIAALKAKDPDALDRLVRDQCHRIYGAILRLVRNPDEASDLVQETFLQALRSLDAFRGHAKAATWLYGIAMNVARNHLRAKRQHQHVLSERDMNWFLPRFARRTHMVRYTAWDPDIVLEKRERVRLVREAIDRLPEPYRVVLTMRDLEELSTPEVAEALSLTEVNVRVRLHRARNALRELLAPHFTAPPSSTARV